ncbi:hypothetical protein WDW86_02780 [Bdellovibrionota bacterium FG-2]
MRAITKVSWGVVVSFLVFTASGTTFAGQNTSKVGAEIKGVQNTTATGILFGWQYAGYESDIFTIGGAGYTGQLTGNSPGSFSYGGLKAGLQGNFTANVNIQFNLLAGGGGGFAGTTVSGGGIVLEPGVSLGIQLGKTVMSNICAGYIYMPSKTEFSGITAGLRVDFLNFETPKAVN